MSKQQIETKRERISNFRAMKHRDVRFAKKMVEDAMKAANNGDYAKMMTNIRLAKIFEEKVIILDSILIKEE